MDAAGRSGDGAQQVFAELDSLASPPTYVELFGDVLAGASEPTGALQSGLGGNGWDCFPVFPGDNGLVVPTCTHWSEVLILLQQGPKA